MRVFVLTAVLAMGLTTAITAGAAAANGGLCKSVCSPAPAKPKPTPNSGGLCKVVCSPAPQPVKAKPQIKPAPVKPVPVRHVIRHRAPRHAPRYVSHHFDHHADRHFSRHAARSDYYSYRENETAPGEWHGAWHQAPDDAEIPGPQAPVPYGPPPPPYAPGPYSQSGGAYAEGYAQEYQSERPCDCDTGPGLQIDRGGWTGGVGYAAADDGFMDGYGVMHYANGSFRNGPTYNSYGQSFQFNPSRAAPFQPRVMGGFAPRR